MTTIHPTRLAYTAIAGLILLTLAACGGEDATTQTQEASLPESLFLSEAPEGIQSIASLKATAKEGDEVVVYAVVGGTTDPIVDAGPRPPSSMPPSKTHASRKMTTVQSHGTTAARHKKTAPQTSRRYKSPMRRA